VSKFTDIESLDQNVRKYMHVFVLFYSAEKKGFDRTVRKLN
jgi:hypothetical protein